MTIPTPAQMVAISDQATAYLDEAMPHLIGLYIDHDLDGMDEDAALMHLEPIMTPIAHAPEAVRMAMLAQLMHITARLAADNPFGTPFGVEL